MALLSNPVDRFWRTDFKIGRTIYALLSNDINRPSWQDPIIGVMETSELAENVVETHNLVVSNFGRHYLKALATED